MNYYNCVYMYTNKINGKRYIGQTKDFKKRHRNHMSEAFKENRKKHGDGLFHEALNRYGIENFQIDILVDDVSTREELNELERSFINFFNTLYCNGYGYNISLGGGVNGNGNPYLNKTEEEMFEIGKKISESKKGINNPMYGKTGEQHHNSKRIIAIDLKTNELYKFVSGKDACKKLSEKYGLKFSNTKVIQVCKYNHDPEKYKQNHNNHTRKHHQNITFYYEEDYLKLNIN